MLPDTPGRPVSWTVVTWPPSHAAARVVQHLLLRAGPNGRVGRPSVPAWLQNNSLTPHPCIHAPWHASMSSQSRMPYRTCVPSTPYTQPTSTSLPRPLFVVKAREPSLKLAYLVSPMRHAAKPVLAFYLTVPLCLPSRVALPFPRKAGLRGTVKSEPSSSRLLGPDATPSPLGLATPLQGHPLQPLRLQGPSRLDSQSRLASFRVEHPCALLPGRGTLGPCTMLA